MKKIILFLTVIGMNMQIHGQRISVTQDIRMLALGDSYTIGESVDPGHRWPSQFVAALRELGVKAEDPDYIAVTGWTTSDLLEGISRNLDREKEYNLVSILIGVNNQYQGIDISTYEPELRRIMDQALKLVEQNKSKVFILSIPDYAYTPFGRRNKTISSAIDAYNAINKKMAADSDIAWIDITPISRRGLKEPGLVAADGLHPSGEQYKEWVEEIISEMLSSESKQWD